MPRTVLSIKAQIRDHSITVPVPENTTRYQIPNACNECPRDRDAAWAAQRMNAWWGDASRRGPIRRAEAFTEARAGDQAAIPKLLQIATDSGEGPFARANALGYLSRFGSDPRVFPAFERALGDSHPLPRIVAALRIPVSSAVRQNAITDLTQALRDPMATVRLGAAVSLVGLGVKDVPGDAGGDGGGDAGKLFSDALALYAKRAELNSDDPANEFAAGRFFLLTGDPARAEEWLSNSLTMDPRTPAEYFLAYALAQQGKYAGARKILDKIGPSDPQYANSQALLKAIAGR
jgi:tetratricopeptide (TPR) repeat protein